MHQRPFKRSTKTSRGAAPSILGHDVPRARITAAGWGWLVVYLGLPVAVLGNLLDLLTQWAFGWCIGLWCLA
ncbi:MAG: hypothetical protein EBS16_06460 [Betaproteobacteria bacterium]|nr:hypothetical protein [Betaproteobacteria bacterium]